MADKQKVMLVDDDETIIETLEYNLKRNGFQVVSFNTGTDALKKLDEADPNLLIIDWMLPDMVGPEIVKLIRSRAYDIPILMLTGRSSPNDVATGLDSGADDYLSKPFSTTVFMARVNALLRRAKKGTAGKTKAAKIQLGPLILDEDARLVTWHANRLDLSPKEFSLLKVLMENPNKALSTEALLNQVWGSDFSGDTKTVAVHVRWLRQKLEEDPKNPKLIETVHRSGYRLNTPVEAIS